MQQAADPLFLAFQQALIGRYSIDRELGRGGMGIVYLAREVHLDRLVAIKLLPPERGREPGVKDRFLREARLAAKLSHPNIIPIHAVEETGGFVYYVMAFVDGETLANRVRTRGPLNPSEGARVLREVAWALAYAHGQGLIHRDVKPDNILLEAATNRVLVADFGIAAAVGDAHDGVSGTPEFMSPEQALGKSLDARSDLYGLGATAFYAFSGRFVFDGKSATEILARQVTEAPPQLAALGLTVPRKLAAVVDRCLSKDPAQRPQSAQAIAELLSTALEQRRELPATLRAFVKRYGRLDGGGTLLSGFALLPLSTLVSMQFGMAAGFTTFFLGAFAAPFGYLTWAARRLTSQGFTHADLAPAFRAEMDQAHEELTAHRAGGKSRLEPMVSGLVKASFAVSLTSFGLFFFQVFVPGILLPVVRLAQEIAAMTLGLGVLGTLGLLALRQRHQDVDTGFWARVWRSRIGKLAFAFARKLRGGRSSVPALTHRATELSLGMAAEELYDSLPRETRKALSDIPSLLARLQTDAQALRKRHEELAEAVSSVNEAASSQEYADIVALRNEVHSKMSDTVGALETIRLNLLRLHAGSATVESVTTHLGIAAEVSEEVERLIAGQDEVARYLNFPRTPASTPA